MDDKSSLSINVPNRQPHDIYQRLLEISVGLLPFVFLALIVILSRYDIEVAAIILIIYAVAWLVRLIAYTYRLAASFYYLRLSKMLDWQSKLEDIKKPLKMIKSSSFWRIRAEKWYQKLLLSGVKQEDRLDPEDIYQAVIIAVYNESKEIVESTIKGIIASHYDAQKIILILAYEERGGIEVEGYIDKLASKYQGRVKLIKGVKHPDNISGEVKAKAGNITYAAKYISAYCHRERIKPQNILVTTLDADAWPHPQYLAALSWTYAMAADRTMRSYQPIPFFTNNIWDVPALVRVIAADSSFWFMIWSMAPKRLRLFSAYAQSLKTLEDINYWNVETVVEDGHQYWRGYFNFKGNHMALPVWLPIYQDAVLSNGYLKTLSDQFRQLRRWAWGVADTPWLLRQAWRDKSIPLGNRLIHIVRQFDDYIAWSTAPIILSIGCWLPLLLSPNPHHLLLVNRLPYIISGLQLLTLIGFIFPAVANLVNLPPRPDRYSRFKNIFMILQWFLEPIALIAFISLASLNAHARLIINKPLETFHATTKVRRGQPLA